MKLRITGGKFRGRTISVTSQPDLRPTISALRQAIFNICQNEIEGANFLDLFAGSGIMGIEALSRGASFVVFIEQNRKTAEQIQKNIKKFDLLEKATIFCMDVVTALKKVNEAFDIVYIDPPYRYEIEGKISPLFFLFYERHLLKKDAQIFLERRFSVGIPPQFTHFEHIDSRKFASSYLHRYQQKEE